MATNVSPVEDFLNLRGELVERDRHHRASRSEGTVLVRRGLALTPRASSRVTELHLESKRAEQAPWLQTLGTECISCRL